MVAVPREALDVGTIIGTHLEGLRHHLRTRLASEHDAEDLAQEACLKFFVEWQRRDDIRNPRAYLQQIAHNLLYVHYSRKSNQLTKTGVELDGLADEVEGLEDWAEAAMRIDRINSVWRELSPKCQQALRLRWREGLRVAEIAEQMSLSQGMVKKYLATGIGHFRKRLNRYVVADQAA